MLKRKKDITKEDINTNELQPQEQEVLANMSQVAEEEELNSNIENSKKKIDDTVNLVCEKFNISEPFSVNGFVVKKDKFILSISLEDYDMVVTLKEPEKHGISLD